MTQTKVIVVEDERIVALHLKQQLSRLGYEVVAVTASGESALEKMTSLRPDAILMDIHIEGKIDGIETATRIPSELEAAVIYVTAYSEEATLARARATKPYGFLVKPFSERELHATIEMAVERRRWDSALQASQEQVKRERDTAQRYLDVAGVIILVLDVEGNVTLINRRGCSILGYDDLTEIIGKPWVDAFVPERVHGKMREAHRRLVRGEEVGEEFCTSPVMTKNGEERLISWHHSLLTDKNGRVSAILSSGEDITERKQAEDNLRLSEERFRSIFSAVSEGIFIVDARTGALVEVNEPGCMMFGYAPGELTGKNIGTLASGVPPFTEQEAAQLIEKAAAGQPQRVNWHCKCKNGRLFWAEISVRFASIGNRDVVLAVGRDITERQAVEAQLRQAQKMEAIGQLTGGIAHDFNNLLAIIYGNLEFIKEHSSGNIEVYEMANDALRAAATGASLTHQLLAYSRQQPLMPQLVRLDVLVSDAAKLLRRTLSETIEIKTTMPPDLWTTRIDPNQLENVMLNLAVNARDAMPHGGKLTIEAANTVLDEHYAEQNPEVTAGPYVLLTVTDSGTGVPKEILDRILEPFFTTKPLGQGTGLGLSMVYGFIKQSGGHLKIDSEVGRGTTVSLYLPKAQSQIDDLEALGVASIVPRCIEGEVILVLEDEAMVRKFAVRVLTRLGYRTIQAADGPQALRLLDEADRVDLLLTDIALPKGMNGPAVAREAQRRRPGLRVLFMSGYAKDAIVTNGMPGAKVPLLTKPFPKAELARKVREILDEKGTP